MGQNFLWGTSPASLLPTLRWTALRNGSGYTISKVYLIFGLVIEFAKKEFDVNFLWAIEKNTDAFRFYEAHGFQLSDNRKFEEGTSEYLVMLKR